MSRSIRIGSLVFLMMPACAATLSGQGHFRDFVLTTGMAAEAYRGGFRP